MRERSWDCSTCLLGNGYEEVRALAELDELVLMKWTSKSGKNLQCSYVNVNELLPSLMMKDTRFQEYCVLARTSRIPMSMSMVVQILMI
jgi:hypothetical protein